MFSLASSPHCGQCPFASFRPFPGLWGPVAFRPLSPRPRLIPAIQPASATETETIPGRSPGIVDVDARALDEYADWTGSGHGRIR
jgi:hypothetical protein